MLKKTPMRMCLGCREMKPKRELIRVVRSPEGVVSLDFKGKSPGRGAYLCRNADCLKRAVKSRALSRAFGAEIPEAVYTGLAGSLEEANG
ncbi:MAG: YlxR family protein [Oscillospiraceae bacterium]|jgi:predicted RNA-binding protein YlxR (DUF448 family)|nr:YlxR family protein [Oscillospiraceae bacterium]